MKIAHSKTIPYFGNSSYPTVAHELDGNYYFQFKPNTDIDSLTFDSFVDEVPENAMEIPYINHAGTNPTLHMLYVKRACKGLNTLYKAINEVKSLCSTSMVGPLLALHEAVNRLLLEDTAYRDANEIINIINDGEEQDE